MIGKKILVVDDDVNLVEAIKVTLESRDFVVVTANDGDAGVAAAKRERPDLIILDIMMDKKHGYAACAEINADPELKNTPVVILSGVGQHLNEPEWTHQQGFTLEADVFLEKPFKPTELLTRIEEILRLK